MFDRAYTKGRNLIHGNKKMDTQILIKLAEEFGLPCIVRRGIITIIGEKQFLIFNVSEEQECQLMEIL